MEKVVAQWCTTLEYVRRSVMLRAQCVANHSLALTLDFRVVPKLLGAGTGVILSDTNDSIAPVEI